MNWPGLTGSRNPTSAANDLTGRCNERGVVRRLQICNLPVRLPTRRLVKLRHDVESFRVSCWLARLLRAICRRCCSPRSSMSFTATSAANDTCTSARLACATRASASEAFTPARRRPNTSGSQLASNPALKLLPVLPEARLRCAEPEAPSRGKVPAICTSTSARDCCSAAWALRTEVLAARASLISAVSSGAPSRSHHCTSGVATPPAPVADQPAGTATGGNCASEGCKVLQPASTTAKASAALADGTQRGQRPAATGDWKGEDFMDLFANHSQQSPLSRFPLSL